MITEDIIFLLPRWLVRTGKIETRVTYRMCRTGFEDITSLFIGCERTEVELSNRPGNQLDSIVLGEQAHVMERSCGVTEGTLIS